MTTQVYAVGTRRTLSIEFKDAAEQPFDPSEVNFAIAEPDGAVTAYTTADPELVKDGTGQFHVDWMCAKEGRHHVRWAGEGPLAVSRQEEIYVKRQATA